MNRSFKVEENYSYMQQRSLKHRSNSFSFLGRSFLMLLVFFSLLSNAQTSFEVTVSRLNVRKSPSPESFVIGSLSKGDIVNVREMKKSWTEIEYKSPSYSFNLLACAAQRVNTSVITLLWDDGFVL